MPSNIVVINSNVEYEVPESFMEPLMAYLDMVKEKCTPKDDGPVAEIESAIDVPALRNWRPSQRRLGDFTYEELTGIRDRAFDQYTLVTYSGRKTLLLDLVRSADGLSILIPSSVAVKEESKDDTEDDN